MWLAPLSQRSITFRWLCVSPEKDSDTHEASAAQRGFNTQHSTAGLSLGPAKRNYLLEHRQVLSAVFERWMLCVTDFCCHKHLLLCSRCLICDVLKKMLRFHTSSVEKQSYLLSAFVCSEVSTVLPDIPYRHVSLCEKNPPVSWSIFSNIQTCLALEQHLCIW